MNEQDKSNFMEYAFRHIKRNEMSDLKEVIAECPDLVRYARDAKLFTMRSHSLLSYAYERKNLDAVKFLISAGADVNVPTFYDSVAYVSDVRHLAETNHGNSRISLVEDAIEKKHYDFVDALVNADSFSVERSTNSDDDMSLIALASSNKDPKMKEVCRQGFENACQRHFNECAAQARALLKQADQWDKKSSAFESEQPVAARAPNNASKLRK